MKKPHNNYEFAKRMRCFSKRVKGKRDWIWVRLFETHSHAFKLVYKAN